MKARGLGLLWPMGLCIMVAPLAEAQPLTPRQPPRRLHTNSPPPRTTAPAALPPGPVFTLPPRLPGPARTHTTRPPPDPEAVQRRVVEFLRTRAASGVPEAQYELGLRFLRGQGGATNLAEARHWFRQAAAQGHPGARKRLVELGPEPEATPESETDTPSPPPDSPPAEAASETSVPRPPEIPEPLVPEQPAAPQGP